MVPSSGLTVPCFHVSVAACTLPPRNAWVEETGDPGSHNPVLYPDANSLNQCQTVHVGGHPSAPSRARLLRCSHGANSKGTPGSYPRGTCSSRWHGHSSQRSSAKRLHREQLRGRGGTDGSMP
ncbi:Hypothetical predicted protein [Podarcis lilfordi]|uniref:Uncharacterized protein n=1 Tax=Podarcis lilfordi TaxID=74358 RepID=A0AA35KFN1_9SAUR|nr:Hypothetical predicted protein [Podarcis lilfordi]